MQTKKEEQKDEVNSGQEAIALKAITISLLNPRYESSSQVDALAKDVDDRGLLQPIILRQTETGGYEVLIGSRRFRAILAKRGPDGLLKPDEYSLEDWDDQFAIGAAVAENDCREPLSPVDEGRFLNRIVSRDPTLTETHLANLTGIGSRPRINDLRHLAAHFEQLPESWKRDLEVTPGDKPGITLTHYKAVRSFVADDGVPAWLRELMDKAAANRWAVEQLKKAMNDATLGDKVLPKATKAKRERQVKPPAYSRVAKLLEVAIGACGTDTGLAALITEILAQVSQRASSSTTKDEPSPSDPKAS